MSSVFTSIDVRDLVKRFRSEFLRQDYSTWKTLFIKPFTRKTARDYVTVLDGITFSVQRGQTVAIIGQNGSGKSTLLKILAGIYKPDQGSVSVHGRVSSLIELGAGFHPEFTGRENIVINGTILGLTKREIADRMEGIIAYAGLGDYIDAPVRTYSSGMYVRLGFSVAVNVDPDVLLVDEVLAVGDEAFSYKCEDKINEFRRKGKTIIMVTHDLGAVEKYANEVIWLDGGCIAGRGAPKRVIDAYRQKVAAAEDIIRREIEAEEEDLSTKARWGDGDVIIEKVRVLDGQNQPRAVFETGDALTVEMDYRVVSPTEDLVFGVAFHNSDGVLCYGVNTYQERMELGQPPRLGTVRFETQRLDLLSGSYTLDVAAHAHTGRAYDYITQAAGFAMRSFLTEDGVFRPPHKWRILPLEKSE